MPVSSLCGGYIFTEIIKHQCLQVLAQPDGLILSIVVNRGVKFDDRSVMIDPTISNITHNTSSSPGFSSLYY